jgi:hypothetical protein
MGFGEAKDGLDGEGGRQEGPRRQEINVLYDCLSAPSHCVRAWARPWARPWARAGSGDSTTSVPQHGRGKRRRASLVSRAKGSAGGENHGRASARIRAASMQG